jgi:hypothetical protein
LIVVQRRENCCRHVEFLGNSLLPMCKDASAVRLMNVEELVYTEFDSMPGS